MATELEIMSHARQYCEKLANGINPLTGEQLPESDIVNNVRISRCLFYVSDVLRQVIEKGGLTRSAKNARLPFRLTEEQRQQFQVSDQPVSVSVMAQQINSLAGNPDMKSLGTRSITLYLEQQGLLRSYVPRSGKGTRREPTEQGRAMGIFTEERQGQYGLYTMILYNPTAQKFIGDHLEQIELLASQPKNPDAAADASRTETVDPETGEILYS